MRLFVTNRTTDNINKENLFYISKLLNSTKSHQLSSSMATDFVNFFLQYLIGWIYCKKKNQKGSSGYTLLYTIDSPT